MPEITVPIRIRRGLRANLPATGLVGEAFFCTDTAELFIWDGSSMRPIGSSGSSSLAGLSDVQLVSLINNDILTYDAAAGKWKNKGNLAPSQTVVGSVNLAGQSSGTAATTIYSVPSSAAGLYKVYVFIVVSRAATVSSVLPDSRILYTDQDSGAANVAIPATQVNDGNTTSTFEQIVLVVNAKASTAISYDIGQVNSYASSGATSMQFAYRARIEYLG